MRQGKRVWSHAGKLLLAFGAIAGAQLAQADVPFSNRSFGILEATLASCADSEPRSASKYHERSRTLVRGVTDSDLALVRETQEYKSAFAAVNDSLSALPKEDLARACAQVLTEKAALVKARR